MPAGSQPEIRPDHPPVDLEAQGRWLAEDHHHHAQVSPGIRTSATGVGHRLTGPAALLSARLPRFTTILKEAAGRLQAQTSKAGQLSPAAEWILDNYYIVAQTLREVQQDLPPHYERQLPRLQSGRPRIYDLSAKIIQTENALLDLGRVQRFVQVYQEGLTLTMGELWALPTMQNRFQTTPLDYLMVCLAVIFPFLPEMSTDISSLGLTFAAKLIVLFLSFELLMQEFSNRMRQLGLVSLWVLLGLAVRGWL